MQAMEKWPRTMPDIVKKEGMPVNKKWKIRKKWCISLEPVFFNYRRKIGNIHLRKD